MDLVVFHKLLNFWHLADELGHLLQVHIISVLAATLFGILNNFLGLSCNFIENISEMSIPEPHPKVILVVQVYLPVVGLNLSIVTWAQHVINDILIIIVVYDRC